MDGSWADPTTATQTRKKERNNSIVFKIIKQRVNGNLYINIIWEKNPQRSWETLYQIRSQVDQGVVYSILKELLNYPRVAKPLGYNKKANIIFAEVRQLVQRLQSAVIKQKTIWKSITPVIAFDLWHNNFKMTTTPLLHSGDKDLEEIQQIVISTKVANLAKHVIGATTDLALMAKKRQSKRVAKSKSGEECFNCRKKCYYAKDCYSSILNKKKPKESIEKAKRFWWKRNQVKVAKSTNNDQNNSDHEPYLAGRVFMTRKVVENQSKVWYLDSCASWHICNSRERFADLRLKSYKFVIARGTIIRLTQVRTMTLPLENGSQLKLSNVAFAPEYDSILIFLGQLRETGISYYDHLE